MQRKFWNTVIYYVNYYNYMHWYILPYQIVFAHQLIQRLNSVFARYVYDKLHRQCTKVFAYIFHIKLQFSKYYLEINSRSILIIILSRKAERYVVYCSNFEITFWSMFFKSPWFKQNVNNFSTKVLSIRKKLIQLCV